MNIYLRSWNGNGREWALLTPVEWIKEGFEVRFAEGAERKTDSEIDELIEKNWEKRGRGAAWLKTGFRALELDLEKKVATLRVHNDDWKAYIGTNENPEFYGVMLRRFNRARIANHVLPQVKDNPQFMAFAAEYSANPLAQCHAILTNEGVPVGRRSANVGVEQGVWHVPGGYFQDVGGSIYKKDVPLYMGVPVTPVKRFGTTPGSVTERHLKANAICNIFEESGGILIPSEDDIAYTGIVWQSTNNMVELTGIVKANGGRFGIDHEHEVVLNVPVSHLPAFAKNHQMVPSGQAALVAAYACMNGLERVNDFPILVR